MKKTFDNIQAGTIFLLEIDGRDRLPFEMQWAKKWIAVRIISDLVIEIRSEKLRRDATIRRIAGGIFRNQVGSSSHNMLFTPTAERQLILPTKLANQGRVTSVMIYESAALNFLTDRTGVGFCDIVTETIYKLTELKIDSMAQEAFEMYKEKTGRVPNFLPVFNSIVSPDLLFLKELKRMFKGEVDMDQMRWTAFKADELVNVS